MWERKISKVLDIVKTIKEEARANARVITNIYEELKKMSANLSEKLANVDASVTTLATKVENLGASATAEIEQLRVKTEELRAAVEGGNADRETVARLTAEIDEAAAHAAAITSRVEEIGSHVGQLDINLMADDESPEIPNLPPPPDEVIVDEDGEATEGETGGEDGSTETDPDAPTEPVEPESFGGRFTPRKG